MAKGKKGQDGHAEEVKIPGASFETESLRQGLKSFYDIVPTDADGAPLLTKFKKLRGKNGGHSSVPVQLGAFKKGVYAFFDYENSPIYVGQTREKISGRIGRHLTNQRTDAVAMSVLDPFEVCHISVWPLPDLQDEPANSPVVIDELNKLERAVFNSLKGDGQYPILLNEKDPPSSDDIDTLPECFSAQILPEILISIRGHPDTRIARRALTISRLAQVISERELKGTGLRRALVVQAMRLQALSEARFFETGGQAQVAERDTKEGEDEKGE
ncbi:GIY-YIG nuclease family protein [Sphingopyxis sp. R3-92]|uniref:GIY-YIG nuclease family protein n=1 Tax=Sphingopyxis sp. R3-92 TaxID=3158553 RepID=UPI003EE488C1